MSISLQIIQALHRSFLNHKGFAQIISKSYAMIMQVTYKLYASLVQEIFKLHAISAEVKLLIIHTKR